MKNGNSYEKMKAAEWRGWAGATLKSLEKQLDKMNATLAAVCARADVHDTAIHSLEEWRESQKKKRELNGRERVAIYSAVVLSVGSIIVALITR